MAAAQRHRECLERQAMYLKGVHRKAHVPKASPFAPGSRPILAVLVSRHGEERGTELFFGDAKSRSGAATLARRGRVVQEKYDSCCVLFGDWALREGHGALVEVVDCGLTDEHGAPIMVLQPTARCSEPKRLERLPIVLTNYMEAFLYPEEAGYNEEANAVLGRPKGGVRGRGDMKDSQTTLPEQKNADKIQRGTAKLTTSDL